MHQTICHINCYDILLSYYCSRFLKYLFIKVYDYGLESSCHSKKGKFHVTNVSCTHAIRIKEILYLFSFDVYDVENQKNKPKIDDSRLFIEVTGRGDVHTVS